MGAMFDTPLTPGSPFEGSADVEAIIATIPRSYVVKGMFCSRFIELLGADYRAVEPQLLAAPRAGRFVPFKDYPQADYMRLSAAAALKRFPRVGLREAVRCLARDDLATFASSMFGKVVLALAGDARSTLLRTPDAYARVAPGAGVTAADIDTSTTRILFAGYRGMPEYTIGQFEGVVLSFGGSPTTVVRDLGGDRLAFDVTHG
jgi:uncharacterized protein (TIGR02265 family)